jgi:hypothetical protein
VARRRLYVSTMLRAMSQSWTSVLGNGRWKYSKSVAFPPVACGMFPMDAIRFNAGGWPERGGGVVLPSKGCDVADILSTRLF